MCCVIFVAEFLVFIFQVSLVRLKPTGSGCFREEQGHTGRNSLLLPLHPGNHIPCNEYEDVVVSISHMFGDSWGFSALFIC